MTTARAVVAGEGERPLDEVLQRWIDQARAEGRHQDVRALEGRDDLADDVEALERAAEEELLADFRLDVERGFAVAMVRAEPEGQAW